LGLREGKAAGCRNLHREDLHEFLLFAKYYSVIRCKRVILPRHVSSMREMKNTHSALVWKLERKEIT
jgi:hypothetical protein